ncbi:tyrosine-protein kinase SRK3-like [Engraulis encrasicolus]|uniref:tyrosine-protein kinase SRK3-like n=1 Tax=Engraulis encrasicolus TaxID=184585 RepID=UPI002FD22D8C
MPLKLFRDCCPCLKNRGKNNGDDTKLKGGKGDGQETKTELNVFENPAVAADSSSLYESAEVLEDENLGIYKALYSFDARTEEEMSFFEGDVFRVTEWLEDWLRAEKLVNGVVVSSGLVPNNYLVKEHVMDSQPWFVGKLNRFEAQKLLQRTENVDGTFLVRRSDKDDVGYVLSVKVGANVKHLRIDEGEDGHFYVAKNQTFPTVEALVNYYSSHSIGNQYKLTEPCGRRKPEVQNLVHVAEDEWELPKSEFTREGQLGSGNFADVYRGKWKGGINVAIKILKKNDALDHREFQLETQMLKKLKHRHLISLIGICTESLPYYIITELMEKGNLRDFLKGPEGKVMDVTSLRDLAFQVSDGMAYLESENSIHRDLAARNVLVGEGNICKVADFGLARVIKEPFYVSDEKKIPYKWTAPEALSHGRFSIKSDVWSFGILLYEIFTYGAKPYAGFNNGEIYDQIMTGYRMARPGKCPQPIYDIMKKCWSESPEDRPSFKELQSQLKPDNYIERSPETVV